MIKIANNWTDYELLDSGNKLKLERWKKIILIRPEPTATWPINKNIKEWQQADAIYQLSAKNQGQWHYQRKLPPFWTVNYQDLTFKVAPTNFKHTGLFPEQASNWDYLKNSLTTYFKPDLKVLNLFGYTGAATMVAASCGVNEVVHVDASKKMVAWAKENMALSHLENQKIRFIVDDCLKFVKREIRRNRKYDIIMMDPPSYGHGPNHEKWILENEIANLINLTSQLLSDDPILFLVNTYTTGFASENLKPLLQQEVLSKHPNGKIEIGDLSLKSTNGRLINCGSYGKWQKTC